MTKTIHISIKVLFFITFSFSAVEMQGQLSAEFPQNKTNLIESEADTRGSAAAILDLVRQKDSLNTRAYRGSVDTQNLIAHTTIIPNAPIPASIDAGTASDRVFNYHKYVKSQAPYDTGNGRPDTDPNDNLTYEYFAADHPSGFPLGSTTGSSSDYPIITYFDLDIDDVITPTQEDFHALGLSSNDGNTLHVKSDIFNSGTIPYIYNDDIKTVISDGGGLMTSIATGSLDKRTDLIDHATEGTILPLTYKGSGDFVNAYLPAANLADIEGSFDGTPPTLDEMFSRVRPGGSHEHRINTYDIDPAIDIQFKTPDIEISGNIVSLTDASIAELEQGGFNGFKPKLQLHVYPNSGVAIDNNYPRNINGIDRPKVGFTISAGNPVDLTSFLNHHGLNISDVDFAVVNLGQNGLSLPATETVLSVGTFESLGFKMYPNPAENKLYIKATTNSYKIEIFNEMGQLVLMKNANTNETKLNLSSLSKGIYILKTVGNNGVGTQKFIKE
jgi:hypothetical protein